MVGDLNLFFLMTTVKYRFKDSLFFFFSRRKEILQRSKRIGRILTAAITSKDATDKQEKSVLKGERTIHKNHVNPGKHEIVFFIDQLDLVQPLICCQEGS